MLIAFVGIAGAPVRLDGQLVSPGELSEAHAALDGLRDCTSCHRLRQRGVSDDLCLACHIPLAELVSAGRGFHAQIDDSCGSCHKEHGGRELDIVRFDSLSFAHAEQGGFELTGAHTAAACRDCHTPRLITTPSVRLFKREHGALERTFLGVGSECRSCHLLDDPHGGQFGRQVCTTCHDDSVWSPASAFDHGDTRYPLRGLHGEVACESCHRPEATEQTLRYAPLHFARCTSCHADYHRGEMGPGCETCHSPRGWGPDRRTFENDFDHSRTGFALVGAHAAAGCSACHVAGDAGPTVGLTFGAATAGRAYARPLAESCLSCHVDQHEGAFADVRGGPVCSSCHSERDWLPTSFDLFRHNRDTGFELEGAHLAVACAACHRATDTRVATSFALEADTCASCHGDAQPHGDQFAGRACTECHTTSAFRVAAFDHDATRYPLDETHRDVACTGCHVPQQGSPGREMVLYRPIDTACRSCHGDPS